MAGKYSELSFFSHRIRIRIEGFRLDRLLDRALKEGLQLKQVRMTGSTELTCWVSRQDLRRLRRLAKSVYHITPLSEKGVFPAVRSFFSSPGLVVGCLLALALTVGQVFFVETIQVKGYRAIPEEALLACLEDHGIKEGAFRPDIDWESARKAVYDSFPQITWVQLGYKGRLVVLNIAETGHTVYDRNVQDYGSSQERTTYTSLVAETGGYVESIQAWYGEAAVEKGDYVEPGQVLISGCVSLEPTTFTEKEEEQKKEYFVNAEGEVWALVPYRLTFNQERYLWAEPAEDGIVTNRSEKTEEQAKRRTEQQIRLWTAENLPETAEIQKKSLKFSRVGNIIEVSVLLEVRQQIAIPQEELIGTKITDTRNN